MSAREVLHIGDNFRSNVIRPKLIAPHDIIHIGDNWRSDWFRLKLMGMKAILIRTRHLSIKPSGDVVRNDETRHKDCVPRAGLFF